MRALGHLGAHEFEHAAVGGLSRDESRHDRPPRAGLHGAVGGEDRAQLVVFVVRPDLWKAHAESVLAANEENVRKTFPEAKWEKYAGLQQAYYRKIVPFLYSRCFGVWGLCRKVIASVTGCFRPIVRQVTESDMLAVQHKSCALAVQTFMLAMSEAGYDTCPLEGFDSARVKKVLGLPCAARVNMIVSCGVRDEARLLTERVRLPFEEQYHRM